MTPYDCDPIGVPCDKERCLAAHNDKRRRHGCPPLQWDETCEEAARKCAQANEETRGEAKHCFCKEYGHGQNIAAGPLDDQRAVDAWYEEIMSYDFRNPGHRQRGVVGHFTQVVWKGTTHVGMVRVGNACVANYWPPGNIIGENYAERVPEILPQFRWRPQNKFEEAIARCFNRLGKSLKVLDEFLVAPASAFADAFAKLGDVRLAEALCIEGKDKIHQGDFVSAVAALCAGEAFVTGKWKAVAQFRAFDTNGDGFIDKNELTQVMRALDDAALFTDENLNLMFADMDRNNDNRIDYQEFLEWVWKSSVDKPDSWSVAVDQVPLVSVQDMKPDVLAKLMERATRFLCSDLDNDGRLNSAELALFLADLNPVRPPVGPPVERNYTDAAIAQLLRKFDEDSDEMLSFVEATKLLESGELDRLSEEEFNFHLADLPPFQPKLGPAVKRMWTEEEVRELLQKFDADKDGALNFIELQALHDSGDLNPQDDSVFFEGMSRTFDAFVKGIPRSGDTGEVIQMFSQHLKDGGKARALKNETSLIVKLYIGHKEQVLRASWTAPPARSSAAPKAKSAAKAKSASNRSSSPAGRGSSKAKVKASPRGSSS